MSSASKGFGAVFGGALGLFFALIAIGILCIGGCVVMMGGLAVVGNQATEEARRAQQRIEQPLPGRIERPFAGDPGAPPMKAEDRPEKSIEPKSDLLASPQKNVPAKAIAPSAEKMPATEAKAGDGSPTEDMEKKAAAKLLLAKNFKKLGRDSKAEEYLQQIVEQFPGTEAAKEAESLLPPKP